MTNKQNALEILRFGRPQRIVSGMPCYGMAWFGANHEGHEASRGHEVPVGTVWTDVFGTVWEKELDGIMGFPRHHPLAEPAALRSYAWPDPDDPRICGRIFEQAKAFAGDDRFLSGSHRETLWEKAYMLVGMENIMMYFHSEPNYVREILHRVMDFGMRIAQHYVDAGIEVANLGDDLGTQCGPLLGPRIVEEFLVPEYRRLFAFYKQRNVIINFHSCGNIASMVDTFMDLGVDVLNPVQASANDLDALRARTQGHMALSGAVSSGTIEAGPIQDIVRETRHRMWQLGRNGGYFCAPDQGLKFPHEHWQAWRDTVDRDGAYPIADSFRCA